MSPLHNHFERKLFRALSPFRLVRTHTLMDDWQGVIPLVTQCWRTSPMCILPKFFLAEAHQLLWERSRQATFDPRSCPRKSDFVYSPRCIPIGLPLSPGRLFPFPPRIPTFTNRGFTYIYHLIRIKKVHLNLKRKKKKKHKKMLAMTGY